MAGIVQWALLDLDVFRQEYSLVTPMPQANDDGTFFEAYSLSDFSPGLLLAASDNLVALLDPNIGIPYIDQPHAAPSLDEVDLRLARADALRHWHADPSIKQDFESYWASLQAAKRGAAA